MSFLYRYKLKTIKVKDSLKEKVRTPMGALSRLHEKKCPRDASYVWHDLECYKNGVMFHFDNTQRDELKNITNFEPRPYHKF